MKSSKPKAQDIKISESDICGAMIFNEELYYRIGPSNTSTFMSDLMDIFFQDNSLSLKKTVLIEWINEKTIDIQIIHC